MGQCAPGKNVHDRAVVAAETLGNFDARSRYSFRPLEQDFIPDPSKVLGEGLSGPVFQAVNRFTQQECAAKVFDKRNLPPEKLDDLRREVNNYLRIDHPHVARLLHVYEDSHRLSLVMELCAGKDLIQRLEEKQQLSEPEALEAAYQILLAVAYLHRHNIVHCDLKLDNCLYDGDQENCSLKLIDFGFSKVWDHRAPMQKQNGTTRYAAPEVYMGNYTDKCDIWSFGVCVFLLLGGYFPFNAESEAKTAKKVCDGKFEFVESRWAGVSEQAKDFVRRCLVVNAEERMSAAECLQHPWMLELDQKRRLESKARCAPLALSEDLVNDLRQYTRCSHLKRAMLSMMALHLISPHLDEIQNVFMALDTDRSGTITRDNLFTALGGGQVVGLNTEELERIFEVVDVAGDGEIHYSEFIAAVMMRRVNIDQLLVREAFELFDVSRTGKITRSDLRRVLGGSKFREADINTLIKECGGCSPKTGITFERFSEHLRNHADLEEEEPCNSPAKSPRRWGQAARRLASKCGLTLPRAPQQRRGSTEMFIPPGRGGPAAVVEARCGGDALGAARPVALEEISISL